ncbi:FAD-dependent oxidoreductase [Nitrosospira sp. Nsp13]|uniref:FAD-dependent oxidoreductase n=1 Tax=Nitrosospira sp. Nsp13 TaxID=1855332 RepID=UPI00087E293B|nr:FAD-dependent oxidoreductase [Nitrosospira sp. Nsp13]SCY58009.1 Glycine/D-amino acid oxidase [Nitrosospira sp. Nsp13]
MENLPSGSRSVWMTTASLEFPILQETIETDVCVIGGGIAGLTTAYLLSREGKTVVLIDAMEIGKGETGRTTAHFFPPDDRYFEIEDAFGEEKARLVAESFEQATALVETIVKKEGIECEFERLSGYLFSLSPDGYANLDKEFEAARKAGVELNKRDRVPGLSFDSGPCLQFRNQAQFHPLKYLNGLIRAFERNGGIIYSRTRALEIKSRNKTFLVKTEHGAIGAHAVVVATNTPFNDRLVMHTKQAAYRTYVVGIRVPKGSVPRILLWDNGDPYYYVRLTTPDEKSNHEILIVGGADHKVGQDEHPEHRYAEIEKWVRKHFPMAGSVDFKWSGQIMEPADGVGYMGRNPMDFKNVYVITGDSGNGMTHCTAGAMLVTDLIMGRKNSWLDLYDPSRSAVHGISDFLKELGNTMAQYSDWVKGGDVDSPEQILPGEGAILRREEQKVAIYRDEGGKIHALSAACTHLGCVVSWNAAETSWDCPCHGSRFSVDGQILHGPAATPLEAVQLD